MIEYYAEEGADLGGVEAPDAGEHPEPCNYCSEYGFWAKTLTEEEQKGLDWEKQWDMFQALPKEDRKFFREMVKEGERIHDDNRRLYWTGKPDSVVDVEELVKEKFETRLAALKQGVKEAEEGKGLDKSSAAAASSMNKKKSEGEEGADGSVAFDPNLPSPDVEPAFAEAP